MSEEQLLERARATEISYLMNPNGHNADGKSLAIVFDERLKDIAAFPRKTEESIGYLVSLLGNARSARPEVAETADYAMVRLEEIWKNGNLGDQLIMRELLLLDLKKRLEAKSYRGISPLARLVIRRLYTPERQQTVTDVKDRREYNIGEMLTQLLQSPMTDNEQDLLEPSFEFRFAQKIGGVFISELVDHLDPKLMSAYNELVYKNQIRRVTAELDHPEKFRDMVNTPYFYLNMKSALSMHGSEARMAALALVVKILERQMKGILDMSTVIACYHSHAAPGDLALQKKIWTLVVVAGNDGENIIMNRQPMTPKIDTGIGALVVDSSTKDKEMARLELKDIKKYLDKSDPFKNFSWLKDQLADLLERDLSFDPTFVGDLTKVLFRAAEKGFDLSPHQQRIEFFIQVAHLRGHKALVSSLAALLFHPKLEKTCRTSLSRH